jgi:divalent metal cation (Fe/Co/Zn/Cd) transporter
VAAFIGISIALFLGKGYESADDWGALFASGFIFYNSYLIFRPALGEIMDEHLNEDLITAIRKVAQQVDGIVDTEKCFIRKAGMKYHVELHAIVNSAITVKEGHELAHVLKDTLREEIPELGHVLIHIEPTEY